MMSTPLTARRSNRVSSQPARYAEQQASYAIHDADAALLRRAQQLSLQCDDPDESDDDTAVIDDYSSSEDESDNKENISPNSSWTQQTHDLSTVDRERDAFQYLVVTEAFVNTLGGHHHLTHRNPLPPPPRLIQRSLSVARCAREKPSPNFRSRKYWPTYAMLVIARYQMLITIKS